MLDKNDGSLLGLSCDQGYIDFALMALFCLAFYTVKASLSVSSCRLVVIGAIGNLGGLMVTVMIYSKKYPKNKTACDSGGELCDTCLVSAGNVIFMGSEFTVSFADKMSFVQVAVVMFLLTEEMLYTGIDTAKYRKIFAVFLFASGLLLIMKSL
ncbi:MAG: hypothetical protein Q7T40_13180 [Methylobacter sp.]|nr:hypothetical protein [Methylobacter sp.]